MHLARQVRDAPVAAPVELVLECLDPRPQVRVDVAQVPPLPLQLLDPRLQPVDLAVVLLGVLGGRVEGAAQTRVVGLQGGDLALEVRDDHVREAVGLGLAVGEGGAEVLVLGREDLVVVGEDAVALLEDVPLVLADEVVVRVVGSVVVVMVVFGVVAVTAAVVVVMMAGVVMRARALQLDELVVAIGRRLDVESARHLDVFCLDDGTAFVGTHRGGLRYVFPKKRCLRRFGYGKD